MAYVVRMRGCPTAHRAWLGGDVAQMFFAAAPSRLANRKYTLVNLCCRVAVQMMCFEWNWFE